MNNLSRFLEASAITFLAFLAVICPVPGGVKPAIAAETSVRISGPSPTYFDSLQAAYDNALQWDEIQAQAVSFNEHLIFDRGNTITLHGGYDAGFGADTGLTVVRGDLRISAGTVIVQNIAIAPDVTAPTVVSTYPLNASTMVSVNTTITATFSEAMTPSSIDSTTFTLTAGSTPVTGAVDYSGLVATFTPASSLVKATTYTAMISQNVKDLAGNTMQSNKTWSFTTATGTIVIAIQLTGAIPESVYTFDTTTPNNMTLLGLNTIPWFNYGLGFNASGNTLYAMDTISQLGTIDPSTGAYTPLGSVSGILGNHNVDGLAADPTTGTIYIVSNNGFTGSSALYSLNPITLSATLIGTQSTAKWLVDLASDLSGNLYTVSLDTDSLYKFNKLNGQVTLIGPLGQDIIGQQGMAFDQSTGVLYGIIGNRDLANYAFGTINMTTGAFTPIDTTGDVRKIAIAPSRFRTW